MLMDNSLNEVQEWRVTLKLRKAAKPWKKAHTG